MTAGIYGNAGGQASIGGWGVSGGIQGGAGYDFGRGGFYNDGLSPSGSLGYDPFGKTGIGVGAAVGGEVSVYDAGRP